MVQLHLDYMKRQDDSFNHVLAYKAQEDRTREPYFMDILGADKLIPYASYPEFMEILKEIQPKILHHYAAGIAEFPMIPPVKQLLKNTKFVQTAVFGNQNEHVEMDRVLYVSKWMQHMANMVAIDGHVVVRNPVEEPKSSENLREELSISPNAYVFGHIGRPDPNTFDNLNLKAYAQIENENTCFIILGVDELAKPMLEELGIKNYRLIPRTTSRTYISKWYNTLDVLAHSRRDGEVNPHVIWDAMAHGIPVISSYGQPFNGHIEVIKDCGWVVNPNDVNEYARIMNSLISGHIELSPIKERCIQNFKDNCQALDMAKLQLDIYKELV